MTTRRVDPAAPAADAVATTGATGSAARWLPLALALLAVLALLYGTAAEMVDIWSRSVTYNHAFLVPPIVLWLIWRRRAELRLVPLRPMPWMLLPVALACSLWLLGELAGVNAASQVALVGLLVLAVPVVAGWAVTWALLFPLLFLFFAVPIGSFLVPTMMDYTAHFTVMALRAVGIPVYQEGLQFVIPSGSWSVVEACSGIRYLIASFMVGTLFAYLNYRSFKRRAIFMLMSIVVPIVANWLRAFLIVLLGHLSNNRLAVGVDHLLYGWVFFGLVIGLMFMVGARWSEPDAASAAPAAPSTRAAAARPWSAWLGAAAIVGLVGLTQFGTTLLSRPQGGSGPLAVLALPEALEPGWTAQREPIADWQPVYHHAVAERRADYAAGPSQAGAWIAYYRDQSAQRKMVTSSNMLAELENTPWLQVASGRATLKVDGREVAVRSADLRGSPHAGIDTSRRLLAWQLYWVGGELTASDARAKLLLAFNRLRGRGDDSAVIVLYTPLTSDGGSAAAEATLQRFGQALLPRLLAQLAQAQGQAAATR